MPTITRNGQDVDVSGMHRTFTAIYTGPASYVTGGDPFVAADVKLGTLQHVDFGIATNGSATRLLTYDRTNGKVMWWVPSTGAEVANAQDMSAYTCTFEAVGK